MVLTILRNNLALNYVEGVIDDCDCVAMEDGSPEQKHIKTLVWLHYNNIQIIFLILRFDCVHNWTCLIW